MKTQRKNETLNFISDLENQSKVRNQPLMTTGRGNPPAFGFSTAKIQKNDGTNKRKRW